MTPRRARLIRGAGALVAAACVGVLVVPLGAWVDTQDQIDVQRAELAELQRENAAIEGRVAMLSDRDNIERQAVALGLARPGDESYIVAPAPPVSIDLPDVWPFDRLEAPLREAAG